jgi:hypothetical protein
MSIDHGVTADIWVYPDFCASVFRHKDAAGTNSGVTSDDTLQKELRILEELKN